MGSYSIWHWLIVLAAVATIIFPTAEILREAGWSRWWAILAIIPTVNLIAFWVFAYSRWPSRDR